MAEELTIEDYERVIKDHRRLVRHIDVIMHRSGAAKQARLCDLVIPIKRMADIAKDPMTEVISMATGVLSQTEINLLGDLLSVVRDRMDGCWRHVDSAPYLEVVWVRGFSMNRTVKAKRGYVIKSGPHAGSVHPNQNLFTIEETGAIAQPEEWKPVDG